MNQAPAEVKHVNIHEVNTRGEEDINCDPSPMLADGAGSRYGYLIYDILRSRATASLTR